MNSPLVLLLLVLATFISSGESHFQGHNFQAQEVYTLKSIQKSPITVTEEEGIWLFKEKRNIIVETFPVKKILLQSVPGPCPIIAIANALSLSDRISFDKDSLENAELLDILTSTLAKELQGSENFDEALDEGKKALHNVVSGMYVDAKFDGPENFIQSPETRLFSYLNIKLLHAWLPDPSDQLLYESIRWLDSTSIQAAAFETDTIVGQQAKFFLTHWASQRTAYGIRMVKEALNEDEIAVMFKNNHFLTVTLKNGRLFSLVTDMGYAKWKRAVWRENESGPLFDLDFKPLYQYQDSRRDYHRNLPPGILGMRRGFY